MNTKWVWAVAISIAAAGLMWQLAGFGALFSGSAPGDDLSSGGELQDTADETGVQENYTGDAAPNDGNLVGLALSSIGRFVDAAVFAITLPSQLMALGLPDWAAKPLGNIVSLLIAIGVVQFGGKRVWR